MTIFLTSLPLFYSDIIYGWPQHISLSWSIFSLQTCLAGSGSQFLQIFLCPSLTNAFPFSSCIPPCLYPPNTFQHWSIMSKMVQRCSKLSELVKNSPKLSKFVQTFQNGPNLTKIVQTCQCLSILVKTCQNLSKLIQTCLNWSKIV